jgi:hypothetical protein
MRNVMNAGVRQWPALPLFGAVLSCALVCVGAAAQAGAISDYEVRSDHAIVEEIEPGHNGWVTVKCPAGKKVLGGGTTAMNVGWAIRVSKPDDEAGWLGSHVNLGKVAASTVIHVWAICAKVE